MEIISIILALRDTEAGEQDPMFEGGFEIIGNMCEKPEILRRGRQ